MRQPERRNQQLTQSSSAKGDSYDKKAMASQVRSLLSLTDEFPDEFKAWLPRWLNNNVNFTITQAQLPSVQKILLVGAAGQAPFQNAWANSGGANPPAGYYIDPFGRVHLNGMVTGGGFGTVIFTLPAGFRPQGQEVFAIVANNAFGAVVVGTNGAVTLFVGSTTSVSLAGISFRQFS